MSTPDRARTRRRREHNPFHVRELDLAEFSSPARRALRARRALGSADHHRVGAVVDRRRRRLGPRPRGHSSSSRAGTSGRWPSGMSPRYLVAVASPTQELPAIAGRLEALRRRHPAAARSERAAPRRSPRSAREEDRGRPLEPPSTERARGCAAPSENARSRSLRAAGASPSSRRAQTRARGSRAESPRPRRPQ